MASPSVGLASPRQNLLLPIFVGGIAAGTLDIISAFITFGAGMPRGIASGLFGTRAFTGGIGFWVAGVLLHYFIACSAAAAYCLASRRLTFLRDHWLVCGAFFGIGVFLVMNLVVLPLSAVPFKVGPFPVRGLIQGIVAHIVLIGVPIGYSLRKFSRA